jgi:tRNA U34 5-carboxymethylaminomethyl modifying GTPase MnmE/TrmE
VGKSGVAVVRISGDRAGAAVRELSRQAHGLPPPRVASLRKLYHRDELLDEGLVLWFPGTPVCACACARALMS